MDPDTDEDALLAQSNFATVRVWGFLSLSLFSFRWFTIERTVLCVWGDGTPYCKEWGKGSLRGCSCCCLACTLGLGNANGEWQWQCERRSHSKHLAHNQNALLLPILRLCVGVISRKNKAVARKKNKKTRRP